MVAAALVAGILSVPLFAAEPSQPLYKAEEPLQLLFHEYRVTGKNPGEGCSLVCTYATRPVVMVYTREISPAVHRLIKELEEATEVHQGDRLGSYVVLFCKDKDDGERDLKALDRCEKLQRVLLSLVVVKDWPKAQAKLGKDAETTVILATGQRKVKACYAYRKDELKNKDVEQILDDLSKILPR
jgi:hypothetical protein